MAETSNATILSDNGADVNVVSYHTNQLEEMKASSPADIIKHYSLSMEGVSIFVDDKEAPVTQVLRDGDLVSFQKSSTKSGR